MESEQENEFGQCRTIAEVIVAVNHLWGMPGVERLMLEVVPDTPRGLLREAASDLKRVGMAEIAELVRKAARKAKPAPPSSFMRRLVPKDH